MERKIELVIYWRVSMPREDDKGLGLPYEKVRGGGGVAESGNPPTLYFKIMYNSIKLIIKDQFTKW
ncbi:hypothetical protein Hanom_Chr05g00440581 [Helianthus anomalus]